MYAGTRSIFGDTINGVANPYVPHLHPWPTRYHGMDRTTVDTMPRLESYRQRPLAVSPFSGLGEESMFQGLTDSALVDAAIGAAIGYFGAPNRESAAMHGLIGGAAGGLARHFGVMAMLAVELFANRAEQGWR